MKKKAILTLLFSTFLLIGGNSFAKSNLKANRQEKKSTRIINSKLRYKKYERLLKNKVQDCTVSAGFNITIGGYSYDITVEATAETCAEAGAIVGMWVKGTRAGLSLSGGFLYEY